MWRMPLPAVIHWVSPLVMTPPPPVRVLVLEDAVDDVGDGLEPTVGVPRRALRLAGGVLHLTHLVHVDERVEGAQRHAGERAAHREALALEAGRRGGDRLHGPVGAGGAIGIGEAGEREDVVDGCSGHWWYLLVPTREHT